MSMSNLPATLLVGAGYVGRAVVQLLCDSDMPVHALVATKASAERLAAMGVTATLVDLDDAAQLSELQLPPADRVVYLVPPSRASLSDTRLQQLVRCLHPPQRFIYISTSGVYGDCDGALVDEHRPPNPQSDRARRRVDAEQRVQTYCRAQEVSWCVLRVPGIYGPGRLMLQSIAAGRPLIEEPDAHPGNRIHRDDLAMTIVSALNTESMQGVFNISDGNPMNGTAFALAIAEAAGLSPPPLVSRKEMQALASPRRWSFLNESRRLDNRRILPFLQQALKYSDPLEGINASLAEEAERGKR